MKKAQVKFGESIGVIFIVFLLLFSGLIWYNKANSQDVVEMRERDMFDQAFEKYYYISSLDLLHYSQNGIVDSEYDMAALDAFYNFSKTDEGIEFLRPQLKQSEIVLKVYADTDDFKNDVLAKEVVLYNQSPGSLKQVKQIIPFKTLIPIVNYSDSVVIGVIDLKVFVTN